MKGGKKDRDRPEAGVDAITRLFGDLSQADRGEIEQLYTVLGGDTDPGRRIRELAAKAAQKHRLSSKSVPDHVQEALNKTKPADLQTANPSVLDSVIDAVMKPMLGPVRNPALAWRYRRQDSKRDRKTVEDLTKELEEDWSGESGDDRH